MKNRFLSESGKNINLSRHLGGFSLIELLVVISIISILVAIGLASYINVQQKARDARRRSDIQEISVALEQQFSQDQQYPAGCDVTDYFSGGMPVDPKYGSFYHCQVDASLESYCVCAELEAGGGNATAPSGSTCNFGAGLYYCQENKQ